ncbi:type VI secretion system-associated FHA domain protein TagH [Variovorax sp. RCC_210]|uniref:type VI secretion system-associated FHA domain protein TagH n=1 Tax=Variovorax sp. RCC_210 TaxID=3239217 RepID=UPI0035246A4B
MIHIAVITRQGAPAGQSIAADFGPDGGTIGRADTNTLVLDDPDRTVSRVHAQVLCRDGRYFVIDRGSNPMQCNGVSLGSGKEAALADGARLVIGSFELTVRVQAAPAMAARGAPAGAPIIPDTMLGAPMNAPMNTPMSAQAGTSSSDDPFADLLAGLSPPAAPAAAPAPRPSAAPVDSLLFPDPMASGSRNAQADKVDPFANLLGPGSGAGSGGGGSAGAPDAFSAFSDFSDLGAPSAHGKAAGIDDLFGGMGAGGGIGGDPLALSPLADPLLQPNTASDADPLAALQRAAPATPSPRGDHLPIDQFGFNPPKAVVPSAPAPSAPPAPPVQPLAQFDDMTGQPIRIVGPDSSGKAFEPLPASPPPPPPPPAYVAPAPRPAAPAAERTATDDELLAAFLRGLASTHQPPTTLTPGLMERVGSMLRSATEGTLQLLLTRQEFKREVRAEVTMIAAQANNPLKFSPTVEVALAHLLGPGVRGFMPPEAAMRDAFDDLRAHQFGVMVGLRAALAHVIARFEPAELEKKISAKTALDALFSANRKAKLWDQFVSLYGGIASEAEDDFHTLFGKAFLQAYEEQMARLKNHGDANPPS